MAVFTAWGDDDNPEHLDDEIPSGIYRHPVWDHGKIWQRDNPMKWWWARRASSIGDSLADVYTLHRWHLRVAAQGMARNSDLLQQMQGIPLLTQDPGPREERKAFEKRMTPFKREADKLVTTALDRVGATRKANRGTALHRVHEAYRRGDELPRHLDEPLAWGLERLEDLLRGLHLHEMERFVVFEDTEPPTDTRRINSCGTLDWTWSLAEGYRLVLPSGELIEPGVRRIGDLKSGDNKIDKTPYLTQPVTYAWGQPFDWTITEADRRDGDNGLRAWLDDQPPARDYALIAHVPLDHDHRDDAALWWVDLEAAMTWARIAAEIRSMWKGAKAMTPKHFRPATVEIEDEELAAQFEITPFGPGAAVKVEQAAPATVTELITERIKRAKSAEALLAVRQTFLYSGWTEDHGRLAEKVYDELIAADPAQTPPTTEGSR